MLSGLWPFYLSSETVSQHAAKSRAQLFFNQYYKENSAPVKYVYNGKRLTTDKLFTPFYIYNHPRGGFVIISAEDKAFPILGYSLESSFDGDKISEGERSWLESYAKDIEMIRYDSRIPEEALEAWRDYGKYVDEILGAPYESSDPQTSFDESRESLERILMSDHSADNGRYSMFYTPAQWQEMIDSELSNHKEVAMGYVDWKKNLHPSSIYGRKGDYYRMSFDQSNRWNLRLSAAEFLSDRLIAAFHTVAPVEETEPEEEPFRYLDSILSEHSAIESEIKNIGKEIISSEPRVRGIGGGHFEVLLPEEVEMAIIYSLSGTQVGRLTYRNTNVANINIEAQPKGFYFVTIVGNSGKPYGIKLYR